ncbi:energy-coupling factor ABC transporter ATP-binding protein [Mobiluncus curtisii]|uniref:energy-coupling factor ABC transporter ATP-binding protein n=1 Tax=Mobiluncus curtisii TaxID=2051 RepID=UPI00209322F7|nr:energy-coupling factor ABC transporter ATP-binding protein [Mobiluncus curtisii]
MHDDIAFALQNLCLDPDTIESRVVQAAAQVGLGEKLHDNPWTLSGGQRQRLAIAVVLAMRPKLLVLDEPTSTIDSLGSRDFYDLIEQLVHQDLGVIVIDHDLDPLLPICDSVLALNEKGEIIAAGTPREVFLNHTQELARCGIWLPRAIRSGCKEALTCSEAGIELPQLNEFCDSQVKYWMRDDSGWHETGESVSARPEALLKLNDFSVPRRCPSISAEFAAGDFVAVIGQKRCRKIIDALPPLPVCCVSRAMLRLRASP